MKRRHLLKTVAGTGIIGSPLLAGCLGTTNTKNTNNDSDTPCSTDGTSYEWCVTGDVTPETKVEDTVFCRRDTTEQRVNPREVLALSAETGSTNWSYKTERSHDYFARLTVDDGVYLTRFEHEDGNGVVALNMDGTERWTRDMRVSYRRPHVANDTVYVVDGLVHAFDAASGDRRWEYELHDRRSYPRIVDVTDTVTVETDYSVLGLDPTAGTVQWEFETGDQLIFDTWVLDGITYVVTSDRIAAVSDGTEQWNTAFDNDFGTETTIVGVASDRVFVLTEIDPTNNYKLNAFDVDTGELSWSSETIQDWAEGDQSATIFENVAYIGGEKLRAVGTKTGTERWQASVGDGPINTLTVIDDDDAADPTVFVQGGETQLATFTQNGEQTWAHSIEVDAPERIYPMGEYVFIGTKNAIFALNRLDNS